MIDNVFSIYRSLPSAWQVFPLGRLTSEVKSKNKWLSEANLLSLSYGKIVRKDITSTQGLLPESFDGYNIVKKGDVVLRLTDLQNDKRSLRTGLVHERGIITSAYTTIQPNGVDPKWLAYTLHAYDIQKVFYVLGSGLRQSMTYQDLKEIPIAVPPVEEQCRIADYLDEQCKIIDILVENRLLQRSLVASSKISKITNLVTTGNLESSPAPGLDDTGWKQSIPIGWELKPLKYVVSSDNSGVWGEELGALDVDIPIATTAHLSRDNRFNFDAMPIRSLTFADFETYACLPGDLVVVKSSGSASNIMSGKIVQVPIGAPRFAFSNFLLRLRPQNIEYSAYLQAFLSSNIGVEQIKRMVSTTTYPNLKVEEYLSADVPLPPLGQLSEISSRIEIIEKQTESLLKTLDESLKSLMDLKHSLVTELVTCGIANRKLGELK